MTTLYLLIYLLFIIVVSLTVSLIVYRLKVPSPKLIIGLIMFLIISPLVVGYFYLVYFNSMSEMTVPDLTGLRLEEAVKKLEAMGLRGNEVGSVYELRYPEGSVVSQRPEGGRKVKSGRIVNLMVSSGRRKVTVPSLIERSLNQAEEILAAGELQLGRIALELHPGIGEGTILEQDPVAGEEVGMGTPVNLTVSTSFEVIIQQTSEVEQQ